jgi:hypothetical protein
MGVRITTWLTRQSSLGPVHGGGLGSQLVAHRTSHIATLPAFKLLVLLDEGRPVSPPRTVGPVSCQVLGILPSYRDASLPIFAEVLRSGTNGLVSYRQMILASGGQRNLGFDLPEWNLQ